MKTKNIAVILTLTCALALAAGCSKTEDSAPPAQPTNKPAAEAARPMMEQATNAAVKAVEAGKTAATAVKDTATQTANTAVKTATDATAAAAAAVTNAATTTAGNTAQGLIDQAKSLVANKQYQPALDTLSKLSGYTLTADQQASVASLKEQIQKLMATDGAKAIGGMLGK